MPTENTKCNTTPLIPKCCEKTTTEQIEDVYGGETQPTFPNAAKGSVHVVQYTDRLVYYVKNTGGEWVETVNISLGSPAPTKLVYTATLAQSGTDAPVATVLENTLGGTVVWTRVSGGIYRGTLTGAFPSGKTVCFYSQDMNNGTSVSVGFTRENNDRVYMQTTPSGQDIEGTDNSVRIEVYP